MCLLPYLTSHTDHADSRGGLAGQRSRGNSSGLLSCGGVLTVAASHLPCLQGDASVQDMSNEAMDTGEDGAHGPRVTRLASATGPSHAAGTTATPATGSKAAPAHTNATGDDGGAAPADTAGTAHCTALSGAVAAGGNEGPSEEDGQEGQAETEIAVIAGGLPLTSLVCTDGSLWAP